MSVGIREFLAGKSIDIEIRTEGGDLAIEDTGGERRESTLDVLYSGGWITCATARTIAGNFEITLSQMGEMLDYLKVKVKQCGLGCF
jgi:hypothetical protein